MCPRLHSQFAPTGIEVPLLPVEGLVRPPYKKLDRARCERAAGFKLTPRAWTELQSSVDYCEAYADPSALARRAPRFMAEDWKPPLTQTQRADLLLILVREVLETFYESGGKRRERLNQLALSLFKQVGVKPPSTRNLRRAISCATRS